MLRLAVLVVVAAVAFAAGKGALPSSSGSPAPFDAATQSARVTKISDGDTFHARVGGRDERVRIIGVDTPELDHGQPGGEDCYADEATRELRRLVLGRRVRLVMDREPRDRYGRLLAYVERGKKDVGLSLLRQGLAEALAIEPNVARKQRYARAERDAKAAGRGRWGACDG